MALPSTLRWPGPALFVRLSLFVLFFFCQSLDQASAEGKKYTVLRVHVNDEEQLDFLQSQYLNTSKFDFWREPTTVGQDSHIMIAEDRIEEFELELRQRNITRRVMIDDVERLIEKRVREGEQRRNRSVGNEQRFFDSSVGGGNPLRRRIGFNLSKYHSFGEVINYLNALAINFPDRVHVQPIGTTHEGRQIPMIKIGSNSQIPSAKKTAIWIDSGIHAREWISPAVALYFIDQLVLGYDSQPLVRQLVDQLDWYVVPLLNPDGYEYSRSSADPEVRLWRKNRSPVQCTQISTGLFTPPHTQCCQGVDLNRNFDWFFGQVGSSSDPCSEIYAGTFAFSEPETRAVRDFLGQQQGRIRTFLTFHSYSQILMYPFGHALRTYPQDVEEMSTTALKAAQALQSMYGTKYTVGTGADTLYPASGGSEDWAKGRMGVKYSFLFELRPEDDVYDGFLLSENQIIPTSRETWEAVKTIATQTLRQFPSNLPVVSNSITAPVAVPAPFPPAVVTSTRRLCRDLDQLCSYWAQNGACSTWPSMRERCPLSCGFCTPATSKLKL